MKKIIILILLFTFHAYSEEMTEEQELALKEAHQKQLALQQELLETSLENAVEIFLDFSNHLLKKNPTDENALRMKRVWLTLLKEKEESDVNVSKVQGLMSKGLSYFYLTGEKKVEFSEDLSFCISDPYPVITEEFWKLIEYFYHEGVHIEDKAWPYLGEHESVATAYTIEFLNVILQDLKSQDGFFKKRFKFTFIEFPFIEKAIRKRRINQKSYQVEKEGTLTAALQKFREELEEGEHTVQSAFATQVKTKFSDPQNDLEVKRLLKKTIGEEAYTVLELQYGEDFFILYLDSKEEKPLRDFVE